MEPGTEFDILEMPFEGLAAYWLSIKKLKSGRKGKNIIAEEKAHTAEPYIKYLLETVFSKLPAQTTRKLAVIRRETLLAEYDTKLELMRAAILAVASNDNPRRTFVTMLSMFTAPPLTEKQAFELAASMASGVKDPASDIPTLVGVDHKLKHEQLMVKLLFFQLHARREGKEGLTPFIKYARSTYFKEGMSLVLDGFDPTFLDHTLEKWKTTFLVDTARKMEMALELALAIQEKHTYDDIFTMAKAYLP